LDLFEQLNRASSDWFGRSFPSPFDRSDSPLLAPVDIRQVDGNFVIEVEVPGFKPEEVEVSVDDRVLTIQGERSSESKEERSNYIRTERQRGRFVRRFTLPGSVSSDAIQANVKDGVLTLEIPQADVKQPKKIPVS
jgi:HSP20 family protein